MKLVLIAASWLLSFLVYGAYFQATWAYGERPIYHITGDEPHYLVIATSVLRDRDLDIYNNYQNKDYFVFYPHHLGDPRDLEDMHALYGRGGALYSKHRLGLPILLLPSMAGGGAGWSTVFMLGLSALLSTQILLLALTVTRRTWAAVIAWLAVAFSPPLLLYAHQFYPEVPGALLTVVGLRGIIAATKRRRGTATMTAAMIIGIAVALLPWFHLRYIPICIVLTVAAAIAMWSDRRRSRLLGWFAIPPTLSGAALLLLDWRLFGGIPTVNDYGSMALQHVLTGAPGLLFDRQFGLLPYAPVFVLALAGIGLVPRALGWTSGGAVLATVGAYAAFIACFSYWYGAFSPPARMLVPIVPVLVVPLALTLATWRSVPVRLATIVLLGLTWSQAHLLMDVPRLRYNLPSGESEMLVYLSEVWGQDVTWLWPSFIQPTLASYLWLASVALAVLLIVLSSLHDPRSLVSPLIRRLPARAQPPNLSRPLRTPAPRL